MVLGNPLGYNARHRLAAPPSSGPENKIMRSSNSKLKIVKNDVLGLNTYVEISVYNVDHR